MDKLTIWAACVVSYNDPVSLNNLLASLNSQSLLPDVVYISDNNSENEINLKDNLSFKIKFIKNKSNNGFAYAANIAINNAIDDGFEKFILFSQDVIIENNGCQILILELIKEDSICFPKMIDRNKNVVFSIGGFVKKYTGNIYLEKKKIKSNFDWADGSCLAFTKNLFKNVNGFNEDYFMYFEDVDFCYRAKKIGFPLKYCAVTASQNPNGPTAYLRSRNSLIFARTTKEANLITSVLLRNLFGTLKSFIKFNFSDAKQRIKGIVEGLRFKRNEK
jgi:GT2 family glycosyltransferase